jgi:hypothetical protein
MSAPVTVALKMIFQTRCQSGAITNKRYPPNMMNNTNGWMGGGRNVALDGDWCGSRGAAGCRGRQDFKEIILRLQPALE